MTVECFSVQYLRIISVLMNIRVPYQQQHPSTHLAECCDEKLFALVDTPIERPSTNGIGLVGILGSVQRPESE